MQKVKFAGMRHLEGVEVKPSTDAAQTLLDFKGEYDLMRRADSDTCILLIGYGSNDVRMTSQAGVAYWLLESDEPLVAVDLHEESMRLAEALR
ncbi:hypothetical protein LCGC14_2884050 [marine sediment metagenome]|uniref:Uncharacterized protein n=1 Tax=marine sediment metagenome TaxID=412755 RepID=A0A0F9A787_9ZZZZ